MSAFFRSLEQLLVSLQWGRQQTYYPSAQPLSTGELATSNHKLAEAINSHLLGKFTSNSPKSSSATAQQLCNTPAEMMAEKVAGSIWSNHCPAMSNSLLKLLVFCRRSWRFWIQLCPRKTRQNLHSVTRPPQVFWATKRASAGFTRTPAMRTSPLTAVSGALETSWCCRGPALLTWLWWCQQSTRDSGTWRSRGYWFRQTSRSWRKALTLGRHLHSVQNNYLRSLKTSNLFSSKGNCQF